MFRDKLIHFSTWCNYYFWKNIFDTFLFESGWVFVIWTQWFLDTKTKICFTSVAKAICLGFWICAFLLKMQNVNSATVVNGKARKIGNQSVRKLVCTKLQKKSSEQIRAEISFKNSEVYVDRSSLKCNQGWTNVYPTFFLPTRSTSLAWRRKNKSWPNAWLRIFGCCSECKSRFHFVVRCIKWSR
jgi:hypothetical protein